MLIAVKSIFITITTADTDTYFGTRDTGVGELFSMCAVASAAAGDHMCDGAYAITLNGNGILSVT